jgi:hypothetical protein
MIRLETGDWVDPRQVVGVSITTMRSRPDDEDDRAQVSVVIARGGEMRLGTWISEWEAEALADRIAEQVNEAVAAQGGAA